MVSEKWFGRDRKDQCLARQKAAIEAEMPLSCKVNFSGPPSKRFISVFEPSITYYSRLGRVMVSFACKKITWHCPCAKPWQSCIHKYVAKWHLFQTEQSLFRRAKCVEADQGMLLCSAEMEGEELEKDDAHYPTTGQTLVEMVQEKKSNIRAEGPRNYADILLSFKHFPNITLYDFARGLATHTNQRVPQTFWPHGGRLCEATDGNIAQAAEGELKVNLPWLKHKVPDPDGHPLTGSSAHYALYDRFHEDNTKDKRDVLRKVELCPEICGSDSRTAVFRDEAK